MATRTIVETFSDLSGAEGAETVTFALDGTEHEIDLTEKEGAALRKALDKYVSAGRKVKRNGGGSRKASNGPSAADVRAWAQANGYDVPERGRIPQNLKDAYEAAN